MLEYMVHSRLGQAALRQVTSERELVHSRKSENFTGERAGQFSQYSPTLALDLDSLMHTALAGYIPK
jgi:hypothetical protein